MRTHCSKPPFFVQKFNFKIFFILFRMKYSRISSNFRTKFKSVLNVKFCENWIFRQKLDFSDSVREAALLWWCTTPPPSSSYFRYLDKYWLFSFDQSHLKIDFPFGGLSGLDGIAGIWRHNEVFKTLIDASLISFRSLKFKLGKIRQTLSYSRASTI